MDYWLKVWYQMIVAFYLAYAELCGGKNICEESLLEMYITLKTLVLRPLMDGLAKGTYRCTDASIHCFNVEIVDVEPRLFFSSYLLIFCYSDANGRQTCSQSGLETNRC